MYIRLISYLSHNSEYPTYIKQGADGLVQKVCWFVINRVSSTTLTPLFSDHQLQSTNEARHVICHSVYFLPCRITDRHLTGNNALFGSTNYQTLLLLQGKLN